MTPRATGTSVNGRHRVLFTLLYNWYIEDPVKCSWTIHYISILLRVPFQLLCWSCGVVAYSTYAIQQNWFKEQYAFYHGPIGPYVVLFKLNKKTSKCFTGFEKVVSGYNVKCVSQVPFFHKKFRIFFYIFSVRLFSVLRGHSFLSSPPHRPMTSDFEGFSTPEFINHIYFPTLILEKEPVFSHLNVQC